MSQITESEIKSMTKEQNYIRGYADGKSDILDKIRAEVGRLDNLNPNYISSGIIMVDKHDVYKIIDKYKVESE